LHAIWGKSCAECIQVLQQAIGGEGTAEQLQVLRSVRSDGPQQDMTSPEVWSRACMAAVLPGAVDLLHNLLAHSQGGLSTEHLQVLSTTPEYLYQKMVLLVARGLGWLCNSTLPCILHCEEPVT